MTEVRAKQIDYHISDTESPVYKYLRIALNNITTFPITLTDVQQLLEFKLPATTKYNLAKTRMSGSLSLPAVPAVQGGAAAQADWTFEDVITLASSISFETAGGTDLCRLNFANNYTKIAPKIATKVQDFLSEDQFTSQLYPCNTAATANLAPTLAAAGASVNYIEPRYSAVGAVNTAVVKYFNFSLDKFVNTIFSYDKDLYFGNEMFIRMQCSPLNKMAWGAPAINDPDTNATLLPNATLNNLYLWLAVEQNDVINNSLEKKFHSGNFHINIPYTVGFTNASNSNVANINVQITKQYGKRLLQVMHSAFNAVGRGNVAYDCNNINGRNITSYRTQLDSKYLQDYDQSCLDSDPVSGNLNNDDWYLSNKKFCKEKVILNRLVYKLNWFHIDRFFEQDEDEKDYDNMDVGLPLSANTMNWTFNSIIPSVNNVPRALIHHTYLTFRRGYTINKDGIIPDVD